MLLSSNRFWIKNIKSEFVCVCVHDPATTNFSVEYNRFEFRVFLLLGGLPYQTKHHEFTHTEEGVQIWIPAFPTLWNTISPAQDLNSGRWFLSYDKNRDTKYVCGSV